MANNPGSVHDKSKDLASSVSSAATDVKNKAQDLGSAAMHQAKDTASHLADKARDAASTVGNRVGDAANYVGQRAEDATAAAGGGLKSLAGQVRQTAPHEGMLGNAASSVAGALDRTGDYLREQGLSGMAEDFTSMVRRNPIPALLIGVAFGFLIARATSRRS
jgi:phage-related tail protein